jgi:hypothetical protein
LKRNFKEKLLGSHGNRRRLPYIKDDPFFKHQLKIVLENCGIINPDSIDAYIALMADLKDSIKFSVIMKP